MSQVTSRTNIEDDDLICPITCELFCDPVLAGDGHVYERAAITKWILENGTSPLTREPLQINDLQSDEYLRRLATQRRNSTVACNVQNDSGRSPLLQKVPINNTQGVPEVTTHRVLFRVPVVAEDDHVYGRAAVTTRISGNGSSPLPREPLQINDLRSDDHLKRLATQRRNSTVACNVQNDSGRSPLLQQVSINNTPRVPVLIIHRRPNIITDLLNHLSTFQKICFMIFCFGIIAGAISVIIVIRIKSSKSYSTSTVAFEPAIMSSYSSALTNDLVFIRPWAKHNRYYYKAIQIVVSTNGFYSFQSDSSIDLYSCLYTGYFNSTNPYINLRTCADNSGGNQQFYFRISLLSGNYTLVATTYFGNVIGNFSIIVYGPTNVTFQ